MTNRTALRIMHRTEHRLLDLKQMLDLNDQKEGTDLIDPKIAALIAQFDTATDKIAARIQKLIDAGGLSPESEAALTAEVAKLNVLGQDPQNPVPTEVAG